MIYVLILLQLYKKHDTVAISSSDNNIYASDAEKLPKEAVRPRSMTADARSSKGDTVKKGFDKAGKTESKDDNSEATR